MGARAGAEGTAASRSCSALPWCVDRVSPARRGAARVGSARAGPRPQRERAQWRASALHAQATSRSEGQGWHVGARAGAEGTAASRSCSALPWCVDRVSPARRGARARRKRTCWASSPERASAETRKRATRASHLASEGQGWHVGARAGAEGTAASRSCSALPWCVDRVSPARRGARARRKRTCWASSPERASAEARKRATRASHLAQ